MSVLRRVVLVLSFLVLAVPSFVSAHGVGGSASTAIETVTQQIGPYEMAVTLELPQTAPGDIHLSVVPQTTTNAGMLQFRVVRRGQSFEQAATTRQVEMIDGPPLFYETDLPLDATGEWELEVRLTSAGGDGVATVPFTIDPPRLPPYSLPLYAALGILGTLLVLGIVLTSAGRGRVPRWAMQTLYQTMFACVVAAAIFGALQYLALDAARVSAQAAMPGMPVPLPASVAPTPGAGRPHVNVALATTPAEPQASQPLTLTLALTDGGTGLPVDDLVSHHEALVHLVVISEDDGFFAHIHPARVAAGTYAVVVTPDRAGRYTAYVEVERADSGTQVISRDFAVGGANATVAAAPAEGFGERYVDGFDITVRSSNKQTVAGQQNTLTFRFAQGGQPVVDLQPWLSMAGHLLARSDNREVFGHIHAAEQMVPTSLLTSGQRFGPDIRFVYTFPEAGRYTLWGQFKINNRIVTVPVVVDVQPAPNTAATS